MAVQAERMSTLQGLERGLAVIQAFTDESPSMTASEVAKRVDISRATARRILLTLEGLGFANSDGGRYALSPRVLSLGWAYLSSLNLWEVARPFMEELSGEIDETCSACTLDFPDIVFVARVPTQRRIMSMSLSVGSRLPASATAMGRVLLAGLDDDTVEGLLRSTDIEPLTEHTVTDPDRLLGIVREVREQGWAVVDQELELGLQSVSVPLRGRTSGTLAALNLCSPTSRVPLTDLADRFLPAMQRTARAISTAWSLHPEGDSSPSLTLA